MTVTQAPAESSEANVRNWILEQIGPILGRDLAKQILRIPDTFLALRRRYAIGSIDITHRCNLKCKHCYFMEQGYGRELSDEEWIEFFDRLKSTPFPFYQASWVGGEPLLRAGLVRRLMGLFKANLVATNGSIPLPDWPDVNFYVSVDGTREYYRDMRGREDLYGKIKENCMRSGLRMTAAMVVSRENHVCMEEVVEEWSWTNIRGFLFQFFTPIRGLDDSMWPGWELRDEVIERIRRMKRRYGDFIINSDRSLVLMRSENARDVTRNCLYRRNAYALAPDGSRKRPCMMGPKADCSRCGCVLPYTMAAMEEANVAVRELAKSIRRALLGPTDGQQFGAMRSAT
jgi:MoaA/NifB/PqqE/SkfB family radical SAM enzyme